MTSGASLFHRSSDSGFQWMAQYAIFENQSRNMPLWELQGVQRDRMTRATDEVLPSNDKSFSANLSEEMQRKENP
jgi:hypothetical protein